ncbi:MAG: Lipoprotein NlpI [Verrucomicrobia subdivision 3 bacterium]|nr:Lipoprotein NlpI [Limisphaerales bacterium]MCS1416935.1 Lipoprotein NlpI [Limisphaerales bacterium]
MAVEVQLDLRYGVRRGCLALALGMFLLCGGVELFGQNVASENLYKRMISAYNAGKIDEALKLADEAISKNEEDPKLFLARGYIHQYERRHQKAIADFSKAIELKPNSVAALQRRGEEYLKIAKFRESVADFERVIELQPQRTPHHWQLGISYYYTGQHKEGKKLFESHQTVNSSDVENAVWHYLCAAKFHGLEKAKQGLLPIPNDSRVPMMEVYALFSGKGTEGQVLERAHQGRVIGGVQARQIFYAYFYLGLYHEAQGNDEKAYDYIKKAAQQYKENGYMGHVARSHRIWLDRKRKEN